MQNYRFVDELLGRPVKPSAKAKPAPEPYTLVSFLEGQRPPHERADDVYFAQRLLEERPHQIDPRAIGRWVEKSLSRRQPNRKERRRRTTEARRATPPTQSVALREQLSLERPNVTLQEALRLVPKPRGSSDLPGEVWRQHRALAEGGEPGLQRYLAERRRLIGF